MLATLVLSPNGEAHRHEVESPSESASWLATLWGHGPMAQTFVLLALMAVVALAIVLGRSRFRTINTGAFMAQVRKLVDAGNLDRAIKLSHSAVCPVGVVAVAGLEAAKGGAGAARAAMEPVSDAAYADATRGFLAARVFGAIAVGLGVTITVRHEESAFAAAGITSVVAFLMATTWMTAHTHATALAFTTAAIEEIAGNVRAS